MSAAVPKSGEVYYAEDGTVSIVLDDNYDPTYEPPDKEVAEYAKWLGIDVDTEKELIYIARDGLKAPLPSEWKPCKTDTGEVYYFNFKSGESIWDHPMDEVYKKKVEDERAKLAKAGGSKAAKLVKGGGGSVAEKSKPMSRSAIEEVRPKSGRLGAIGTSEEQKTVRPDISALLPTKSEQIASTLGLGKTLKKEPLKDMKEMERNIRKRYDIEFDAVRATLQDKHDKQLQELKASLEAEKRKQINALKQDVDDEVDQAQRNGERRNKRELGLYEDSVEKQKEDLRRTLRSEQEELARITSSRESQADTDLATERKRTEDYLVAETGRRRQEIHQGWEREKQSVELETQRKIRELGAAHNLRLDANRGADASLPQAVESMRRTLQAEWEALEATLASELSSISALKTDAQDGVQLQKAQTELEQSIATAKADASQRLADERATCEASMRDLLQSIEQRKVDARSQAAAQSQQGSAERIASRRTFAATRVREAQEELNKRLQAEKEQFEAETSRLVAQAQRDAANAAAAQASAAATSAEAAKAQALAQRKASLEDKESQHRRRMELIAAEASATKGGSSQANPRATAEYRDLLAAKKAAWAVDHPAPVYHLPQFAPVPVFDPTSVTIEPITVKKEVESAPTKEEIAAVVQAEVSTARLQLDRDNAAKLEALRQTLRASFQSEIDAHRNKAMSDMEARLATYRSSGGSPLRAAKARVASLPPPTRAAPQQAHPTAVARAPADAPTTKSNTISYKEADMRASDLRTSLQRALDEVNAQLTREAAAAADDVKAAQEEIEAATRMLSSQAAITAAVHVPPRPMSASGSYGTAPLASRAQTADAAYFQVPEHMPVVSSGGGGAKGRSTTPGPAGPVLHATPSKGSRQSTFHERLAKAQDLLRRKKKAIKSRQEQLEIIRADWKRDMSAAKASRDEEQIRTLKRVAEVLEADARQLNREALALKESQQWLKEEGEGYYLNKQMHRSPQHGGASGAPSGDVGVLLADILRRTDTMEGQVSHVEAQQQRQRTPQPGSDVVYSKWQSWLQRQPSPAPGIPGNAGGENHAKNASSSAARAGQAPPPPFETSPKKRDVERWLKDQQRR